MRVMTQDTATAGDQLESARIVIGAVELAFQRQNQVTEGLNQRATILSSASGITTALITSADSSPLTSLSLVFFVGAIAYGIGALSTTRGQSVTPKSIKKGLDEPAADVVKQLVESYDVAYRGQSTHNDRRNRRLKSGYVAFLIGWCLVLAHVLCGLFATYCEVIR